MLRSSVKGFPERLHLRLRQFSERDECAQSGGGTAAGVDPVLFRRVAAAALFHPREVFGHLVDRRHAVDDLEQRLQPGPNGLEAVSRTVATQSLHEVAQCQRVVLPPFRERGRAGDAVEHALERARPGRELLGDTRRLRLRERRQPVREPLEEVDRPGPEGREHAGEPVFGVTLEAVRQLLVGLLT